MTFPVRSLACSLVTLACVAPAAVAEDTPEVVCTKLRDALQTEVELLEGIDSAEAAQAAVKPLKKSLEAQNALFGADDEALWDYISNTQGAQLPLVELLQRMAVQLGRLEEANYFDNAELRDLLYTQVVTEG